MAHDAGRGTYKKHAVSSQKCRNRSRNLIYIERNSSIELLRIIAMFMILMHHFIVHNGYDVLMNIRSF